MNYYDTDFFIIFIERVPMLLVSMVSDKVSLFQGGSSCPPAPGIELVPQVVLSMLTVGTNVSSEP